MINGKKFYGNMKEVTEKNNGEIIQKKKINILGKLQYETINNMEIAN